MTVLWENIGDFVWIKNYYSSVLQEKLYRDWKNTLDKEIKKMEIHGLIWECFLISQGFTTFFYEGVST